MFRIMHGGRALEYERTVRLPPDVDLRWRIQSGQDGWLGVGYLVDALVYSLREEGPGTLSVVRKLGQTLYPDIRAPLVAGEISESAVALSPDGERFAQAFMYNSRVHTYRSDGTLERRIAGPVDVRLEISRLYDHRDNQEKTSRTNETKLAYLDVAADNTRIAALFAGRRYASFEGKGALSGNEVHVFSWTGECLDVVRLSEDVMAIAIEPTDGSLWGSAPDGRVLRFQALGG